MTDKITLTNLADLQNETTAVNAINGNNATLTTALDNTLSRDGTAPNQMLSTLDMNSNRIINLPSAISISEPATLGQLQAAAIAPGTPGVTSVGGLTGVVVIGAGLTNTGGTLNTATTSNVTSIGGLTGAVPVGAGLSVAGGTLNTASASSTPLPIHQGVLKGNVGTNGLANYTSAGSGLTVNLAATTTPLYMAYASGFSPTVGLQENVGVISSDQTSYWTGLKASNTSYLSIDRNSSTGVLIPTSTIVPPQTGPVFDKRRAALLHMDGSALDDNGNTWNNSSGSFNTTTKVFGSASWQGSGVSSYLATSQITNIGQGPWTIEFFFNIPTLANGQPLCGAVNNAGYGSFVQIVGTSPYHLNFLVSSTGNSWDAVNVVGPTNITAGVFHHLAMCFDGTTYRLYLDGVQEIATTNSAIVCPITNMALATQIGVGGYTAGFFDEFRFSQCARYTSNFTIPAAPFVADGDWFDSTNMVMNSITGAGPTYTPIQRVYVGKATTNGSSTTSTYSYNPPCYCKNAQSQDPSYGVKVGNMVYTGAQQLSTSLGTTTPVTFVLSPSQVPPDAVEFYLQMGFFHVGIDGSGNSDVSYSISMPGGGSSGLLGQWSSSVFASNQFVEPGGQGFIAVPVVNGIPSFIGLLQGNTKAIANVTIYLTGYKLP